MMRTLLVLAALTSCKPSKAPAAEQKGSQGPPAVSIDAPSPDARTPDAAPAQPTEAQALEAGKRWIAAAAKKDPQALVAASALPFTLTDEFNYTKERCSDGTIAEAAAFTKTATCLQAKRLRSTFANTERLQITTSLEVPEPGGTITGYAEQWNALVPEAERASHAFVEVFGSHPDFHADVLYALLSVRLVDGAPIVDGAVLVFTSEGG
jgi:hypothetical protein